MDDIWTQYEPVIRRLYQDERKELKEVKEILETEHGFPQYPLWMYVDKVRVKLKLRKKLKKGDWVQIYQIAQAKGYQKYDVYLNGSLIPWDKVWKEIRRSGARQADPIVSNLGGLAPEVSIMPRSQDIARLRRTKGLSIDPDRGPSSACLSRRIGPQRAPRQSALPCVSIEEYTMLENDGLSKNAVTHLDWRTLFVDLAHETLPWHDFRRICIGAMTNTDTQRRYQCIEGVSVALMPYDGFFKTACVTRWNKILDTIYPNIWDLQHRSPPTAVQCSVPGYWRMVTIVYIQANGLENSESLSMEHFNEFGKLLSQVPQRIAVNLLNADLLSMRAVWDRFLDLTVTTNLEYSLLMFSSSSSSEILLEKNSICAIVGLIVYLRPDWIAPAHDAVLMLAALVGKLDLVTELLSRGVGFSLFMQEWTRTILTAITMSTLMTAHDCVRVLAKNCDLNAHWLKIDRRSLFPWFFDAWHRDFGTQFTVFLKFAFQVLQDLGVYGSGRFICNDFAKDPVGNVLLAVDILLEAGADVYTPFPFHAYHGGFPNIHKETPEWAPTCLDASFYLNEQIFDRIISHLDHKADHFLARHHIYNAAAKGKTALGNFLDLHLLPKQPFLLGLFCELFYLCDVRGSLCISPSHAGYARSLIEAGLELKDENSDTRLGLLKALRRSIQEFGINDDFHALFVHLCNEEQPQAFWLIPEWVEEMGTVLLDRFAESAVWRGADIAIQGAQALLRAAVLDNHEAVIWLLRNGVDMNTPLVTWREDLSRRTLHANHEPNTILGEYLSRSGNPNSAMCRRLVCAGAKLQLRSDGQSFYSLLLRTVARDAQDIFQIFKIFEEYPDDLQMVTQPQWNLVVRFHLLHGSQYNMSSRALREVLFQKYFVPDNKAILAPLITGKCNQQLIQKVINEGAELNDYSIFVLPLQAAIRNWDLGLAYQLIKLGADVNYIPLSSHGSALYETCKLRPSEEDQKQQKAAFIETLVQSGAGVNGNTGELPGFPRPLYRPPLHGCIEAGDIDSMTYLLKHLADPNHLGCYEGFGINQPLAALDVAAMGGRLDIAKVLLNVGAISSDPASTGYGGALELATESRCHAIVELIHRHISHNDRQFAACAELKIRHENILNQVRVRTANTKKKVAATGNPLDCSRRRYCGWRRSNEKNAWVPALGLERDDEWSEADELVFSELHGKWLG